MAARAHGGQRLSGLRLVVVALSLVGIITTSAVVELFRFGEVTAALSAGITRAAAAQDALARQVLGETPLWLSGRLAAGKAALDADLALWGEASAALSRVLTLSLGSIVVLLFMIVLRMLAYLVARDRTEAELRRATAEAERANAAKTEFLATMSHEIRTPLTAIRGYADLLAEGPLNRAQRDRLARLADANAALALLVDDLLDLSKIEAGRFGLHPAPLELAALVDRVLGLVQPAAMAKGLTIRAEIAPDLPRHVLADGTRLMQVLLNLANNAVKFTDKGHVTLSAQREAEWLVLSVADTGIGIAPGDLGRLFRRFSQIDSSLARTHRGTGLGLAISRGLVRRMGGEIAVHSVAGEGSTFTVTMPLVVAEGPGVPAPMALPRPDVRPARILVVEDSPQNQDLIRAVLERDGHRCTPAWDGIEGVAAARDGHFDLVIMDMQLPRRDGIAATAALRELPGAAGRVPVLALSANALPDQIAAMRAAGADRHLAKPFAIDALSRVVSEMLGATDAGAEPPATGALAALVGLLGPDWVRERLDAVLAGLDWADAPPAPAELRQRAHRLVSECGQLGLATLGEAAARLDERIGAGLSHAAELAVLRRAAREARTARADMIACIARAAEGGAAVQAKA